MLNFEDRDPTPRLLYSEKQIKGMVESWFCIGAGTGVLVTVLAMWFGLHWVATHIN